MRIASNCVDTFEPDVVEPMEYLWEIKMNPYAFMRQSAVPWELTNDVELSIRCRRPIIGASAGSHVLKAL